MKISDYLNEREISKKENKGVLGWVVLIMVMAFMVVLIVIYATFATNISFSQNIEVSVKESKTKYRTISALGTILADEDLRETISDQATYGEVSEDEDIDTGFNDIVSNLRSRARKAEIKYKVEKILAQNSQYYFHIRNYQFDNNQYYLRMGSSEDYDYEGMRRSRAYIASPKTKLKEISVGIGGGYVQPERWQR